MNTPVALIIYHRPKKTSRVVASLRQVKPKEIFVIADGPKSRKEKKLCDETRKVIDTIDWKCKIYKKYASKNLGLRTRVVTGLNWVFSKVDRAIILEDDLVIDKSFYGFCEKMLEKYKDNDRVISIAGNNFIFGRHKVKASYFFSRYVYVWGWATWRRAWKLYDDSMTDWPRLRKSGGVKSYLKDFASGLYWERVFDLTFKRKFNSWAYCWTFTAFKNKMLTIVPSINLVSNVGYGVNATHTRIKSRVMGNPIQKIKFPLKSPLVVERDVEADKLTEWTLYMTPRIVVGLSFQSIKSFLSDLK